MKKKSILIVLFVFLLACAFTACNKAPEDTTKPTLVITANNNTITYGEEASNQGVTYAGFVDGDTASILKGKLEFDYSYRKFGDVGTYSITPKGLTSDKYEIQYVAGSLNVKQYDMQITINNSSIKQGEEPSNNGVKYATLSDKRLNLANIKYDYSGYTTASPAGEYAITVSGIEQDNKNYKISYVNGTMTVAEVVRFTVSFNSNGGGNCADIVVEKGETLQDALPIPTRDSYEFLGWFTDNTTFKNAFTAETVIESNITIYAKWAKFTKTLTYDLNDDGTAYIVTGVSITSLFDPEKNIIIPATYNGLPVTEIAVTAFAGKTYIESITISSNIEDIAEGAFSACTALNNITVANENSDYSSIDGNLYNKAGTILIQYAIGKTAETFAFPDSAVAIGNSAFSGCDAITSMDIPSRVRVIGVNAFGFCTNLSEFTVGQYNFIYKAIGGNLYDGSGTVLIQYAIGKTETTFEIPEDVRVIGTGAFTGAKLQTITMPNSVTNIGISAFSACTELENITLSNKLTSIGSLAFSGCISLETIVIPKSVTSIGATAFLGCVKLSAINVEATKKPSGWEDNWNGSKLILVDSNVTWGY